MIRHQVKVHPSAAKLPREQQLAWHLARFAVHAGAVEDDVAEMVACRIVDNASVALAAINRKPVAAARAMAVPARVHSTRIESALENWPHGADIVTARALAPLVDLLGLRDADVDLDHHRVGGLAEGIGNAERVVPQGIAQRPHHM